MKLTYNNNNPQHQQRNISHNSPQLDSVHTTSSPISMNPGGIQYQQHSALVTGSGSSSNLSPRLIQAQNNSAILGSSYQHPTSSPLMRQIAQLQRSNFNNNIQMQQQQQFPLNSNIQIQKINQSQELKKQHSLTHNLSSTSSNEQQQQQQQQQQFSSSSNKKQMMMMNRLIQPRNLRSISSSSSQQQQPPQVTIVKTNKPNMTLVDQRSDQQTPLPPEYSQDEFQKDNNPHEQSFHLGLLHDYSLKGKYNSQPDTSIFSKQKKFSKQKGIFKSRMNRTSPKNNSTQQIFDRTDSYDNSRNNKSMVMDSQSSIKLQNVKKKYQNVRSKLQGYHDPKQGLKKIQQLERKIRQQQRVIDILNQDKALLEQDNKRNKQINKKLFQELTTSDDDNHTTHFASISTNPDGAGSIGTGASANSMIRGSATSMQNNNNNNPQMQSNSSPISGMRPSFGQQQSQYYSNINPISLNGSSVLINSSNNNNLVKNSSNLPNIVNQQQQQQENSMLKKPGSSVLGKSKNRPNTLGELHSIYQDLFLTDMKQEVSKAKDQMLQFRQLTSEAQKEINSLKKSNYSLNSTVKRYRKMMQQMSANSSMNPSSNIRKNQQQASVDDSDTRSMQSSALGQSIPSLHQQQISHLHPHHPHFQNDSRIIKSFAPSTSVADRHPGAAAGVVTTVSAAMIQSAKLQKFDQAVVNLSKENLSLMDILILFLKEIKSIMRCQYANAYIFDQGFARLLREHGIYESDKVSSLISKNQQSQNLQKLYFDSEWVDVLCLNDGEMHEPAFRKKSQIKYGIRTPDYIAHPVKAPSSADQMLADSNLTAAQIATGISENSNDNSSIDKKLPHYMLSLQKQSKNSNKKKERIIMGVQCLGKTSGGNQTSVDRKSGSGVAKHAGGKGFHRVDELLLKVLCNWLSQRIQVWITSHQNKMKQRIVQNAIQMTSVISVQKTHKHMILAMRKLIPGFFGFSDCGVLVYSHESMDFFTISESGDSGAVGDSQGSSIIGRHKGSTASQSSIVSQATPAPAAASSQAKVRLMQKIRKKGKKTTTTTTGKGSFNQQALRSAVKTRLTQDMLDLESHIEKQEIIRFPCSIGVTGHVFKQRSIYYSNKPAKDMKWNPDIDNLSSAGDVKNFMIGALQDSYGKPVGIVQLINKIDDSPISDIDQARFDKMRQFLGICFENTNITHLTLGITLGVKQIMDNVTGKFREIQQEEEQNQFGVNAVVSLQKHLDMLRMKLTELANRKVNI